MINKKGGIAPPFLLMFYGEELILKKIIKKSKNYCFLFLLQNIITSKIINKKKGRLFLVVKISKKIVNGKLGGKFSRWKKKKISKKQRMQ